MENSSLGILRRLDALLEDARIQQLGGPSSASPRNQEVSPIEGSDVPRFSVVAPCFGRLKPEGGQKVIDETLEMFIHGSLKSLETIVKSGVTLTWSTVSEAFMQSPYMMLDSSKKVDEHKIFQREKRGWAFGSAGEERDENVYREIEGWLHSLLNDVDVIESTKIPIGQIADIVTCNKLLRCNGAKRVEKPFVEVGILRYPDISSPHIRIYRVKLLAWGSSKRKVLRTENRSGIQGHFLAYHFNPRREFIQQKCEMAMKVELEAEGGVRSTTSQLQAGPGHDGTLPVPGPAPLVV